MQNCKPISIPFLVGSKLSLEMCSNSNDYIEEISNVPYPSVIGTLKCTMVCTRLDIAKEIGVLSRFM